jgi:purine nucleoside permease
MRLGRWFGALAAGALWVEVLGVSGAWAAETTSSAPVPVKVMIVSMFGPEGQIWLDHRELKQAIPVPGLSPDYPDVHCGTDGVCQLTTGMGHANAAASVAALIYSRQFDLRHSYWLFAGIAGIDPKMGTLGSAAWARYLVDWGLQWELDAREAPKGWPSGYLGINTKTPDEKPRLDYRTEVYQLNEALLQRAFALSRSVTLSDSPEAQKTRAAYGPPANQPPAVIQCDTLASDTWWSGTHLGERAEAWTKLLTEGRGTYCTTQQEDNASYEVLKRATAAGLADDQRVAVLRSGADFDRPPPGGSDAQNLLTFGEQGGFVPALQNLYLAGNPLVQAIVSDWPAWEKGVPLQ